MTTTTSHAVLLFLPPLITASWKYFAQESSQSTTLENASLQIIDPVCEVSIIDESPVTSAACCGFLSVCFGVAIFILRKLKQRTYKQYDYLLRSRAQGVQTIISAEPNVIRSTGFHHFTRFGFQPLRKTSPNPSEIQSQVLET